MGVCRPVLAAALASTMLAGITTMAVAQDAAFDLKFGVLAGLTGDPAADGQTWNASAKLAIDVINESLARLQLTGVTVELTDSQDSQGTPAQGVEAAQKLVQIDGVNVIVGDFYSSVTSAVATAVTIPNQVLVFTGGTNPALTQLNTGPVTLLWQPVAADDAQGRALAALIADALGPNAKINVAARNDAYGTSLAAVFKDEWTAGGGTIGQEVLYNQDQPTLDTEAQQVASGSPDGWLFVDFCQTFEKLAQPLARTGQWDPAKSFGSDTLNDCATRGSVNYPGLRATQANASSGASFPAFKALFEEKAADGIAFQPFTAEAFDSVFVAFLSALAANSATPTDIAAHVVDITNDPGNSYTFEQLDDAIKAVLGGEDIHFVGATGPLAFSPDGRVNALAYDVWQHQADGSSSVVKTIQLSN